MRDTASLLCPVCGGPLTREGGSCRCAAGHCFDLAKQNYVNLLRSNVSAARRHGDDAAMVRARRAFLDKGYYRPVLDAVLAEALPRLESGCVVLDAGCGEGYYTAGLAGALRERGTAAELFGADISTAALKAAAGRRSGATLAAASCARLPLGDGSCGLVLNLFSPLEAAEYARVLRPGGTLLRAVPLERHLWSLKAAVYARPYENDVPDPALPGFGPPDVRDVRAELRLPCREDIAALFHMTPYWYKTGRADQEKLAALETLTVELEVRLLAYLKEPRR